jgi:hypothetical protein
MRLDEKGWLQAEAGDAKVVALPTVRTTTLEVPSPLGLVWHTTGGVGGPNFAEVLARRIQDYRRGVDRPASWHFLIAKNGDIFQSASFSVGTWHVGMPGNIAGWAFKNINHATIGVELANAGPLLGHEGQFYAWPYWKPGSDKFPEPRFRIAPGRVVVRDLVAFDGFPDAQIASAGKLAECLARRLGWDVAALQHGHADFAAPRKTDPGPLWMKGILPGLIAAMELGTSSGEGRV